MNITSHFIKHTFIIRYVLQYNISNLYLTLTIHFQYGMAMLSFLNTPKSPWQYAVAVYDFPYFTSSDQFTFVASAHTCEVGHTPNIHMLWNLHTVCVRNVSLFHLCHWNVIQWKCSRTCFIQTFACNILFGNVKNWNWKQFSIVLLARLFLFS